MKVDERYVDEMERLRSLLIVTSLQKKRDLALARVIDSYKESLVWSPLHSLMIEQTAWDHVCKTKGYSPAKVFCHPDILTAHPETSFYYRGLCALSLKIVTKHVGSVAGMESGSSKVRLKPDRALRIAQLYNTFISAIISGAASWTLENGYRTIIANLGITLDGVMRNKIGQIAEDRVRTLVLQWLEANGLLESGPTASVEEMPKRPSIPLKGGISMKFGSEPDIAFYLDGELIATVEIKGGTDTAGALERYGAAKKSFEHAIKTNPQCKNFYLGACFTPELLKRIKADRMVEKTIDIIKLLEDAGVQKSFFDELFHHVLRLT